MNLFLVAARNQDEVLDGTPEYEAGLVNWSVGRSRRNPGCSGSRTTTGSNGTQSGVLASSTGSVVAGYGLTTTMIHEYGHHPSMSHPHDGLDPGTGTTSNRPGRVLRLAR